jgi:hypothetical protein
MRPPTKLHVFANFWPPKILQPFITPRNLQIYLRQTSTVPLVENEVKRTPICGCLLDPRSLTYELKKVQKEKFSADFQKLYRRGKACICAKVAYFE